jgi:hypothetical protein
MRASELRHLLRLVSEIAGSRSALADPSEVEAGAVWADRSGKLTGDLVTTRGPISFSSATIGRSIPPDPQLSIHLPLGSDHLEAIRESIRQLAESGDTDRALKSLTELRGQLADCLGLTDTAIGKVSVRLEIADLLAPDTDPVRRVRGIKAWQAPDDGPLTCDPDERSSD